MKNLILKSLVFLSVGQSAAYTLPTHHPAPEEVCFRFYRQWEVKKQDKQKLQKKYNLVRLRFNEKGQVIMEKLPIPIQARFDCFYRQCMQDGCLFCDADEGSCETGTCGPHNSNCKPYMGENGPLCGEGCVYYALNQL